MTLSPGDRVVLTFASCGTCSRCTGGFPAYCASAAQLNFGGMRPDGSTALRVRGEPVASHFFGQSSFATYALATERNAVRVSDDMPLDLVAPLGCGVQTGAGAVMNALACIEGSSLLVTGAGSVGLSAVLAAVVQQCATIIVVEPFESSVGSKRNRVMTTWTAARWPERSAG
jgi:aryl-alcohol dehydrogenase